MNCGIDFGTANCSVGILEDGKPKLIDLSDDSKQMTSALHSVRAHIETIVIDEYELSSRVKSELASQTNKIAGAISLQKKSLEHVLEQITEGPSKVILRDEIVDINLKRRKERSGLGELKSEADRNKRMAKEKLIKEKYDKAIESLILAVINEQGSYKDGDDSKLISSTSQIRSREHSLMRREAAEALAQKNAGGGIASALFADSDICFGEEAVYKHMDDPNHGYFIKSPKAFLGADLNKVQINVFTEIVTRFFAFLKASGEKETGYKLKNSVIGKPVNFHGNHDNAGNNQALDILYRGAISTGFQYVEFLYEPIAAALHFEQSLKKEQVVLVLDAGGGTTDCSVVKLGPAYVDQIDRQNCILGNAGTRIGGMDLDYALAMAQIMPLFGLTTDELDLAVPNIVYSNAIIQNDVNARAMFLSDKTGRDIEFYLRSVPEEHINKICRLQAIYQDRLGFRLNRSAELAKIALSEKESITLPLNYVENNLVVKISSQDLESAVHRKLKHITELMDETLAQSGTVPDIIYVTGGTAKSPVVDRHIRARYGDINIIVGDHFGSVAAGLTTWASKIYR